MKKLYKRNDKQKNSVEAYAVATYASCSCPCSCKVGNLNSILNDGGLTKSLNKYS